MIKKSIILILLILGSILSSALISYSIDEKVIEIQVGESVDLMALLVEDNSIKGFAKVIWESGNNDVATISSNGIIVGKSAGRTHISVTISEGDNTSTAMVFVSVSAGVESIAFEDEKISIIIGEAYTPAYKLKPYEGINKLFNEKVRFISSDNKIVKIGSNNSIVGVSPGKTKIYVITEDGHKYDFLDVEVVHGYERIDIKNMETDQQFYVGEKIKLELVDQDGRKLVSSVNIKALTIQPYYGYDPDDYLAIMNGSKVELVPVKERIIIPDVVKLSSDRIVEFVSPGQVRIDVETIGERKTAVVVEAKSMIKEVNLDRSSVIFDDIGAQVSVEYNIVPDREGIEPLIKGVIWKSSDSGVASVDSNGVITSKGVGYAQISVETVDGHFKDALAVEVKGDKKSSVRASRISVTPEKKVGLVGEKIPLDVIVIPENTENKQITFNIEKGIGSIRKENDLYYFMGIKEGKSKVICTSVTGPITEFEIEVKSALSSIDIKSSLAEEKSRKIIYLGQETEIEVELKSKPGYSEDEIYEKGYSIKSTKGVISASNQSDNSFKVNGAKVGIDTLTVKTKDSGKEKRMLFEVRPLVEKIKVNNKDISAAIGEKMVPEVSFEVKSNIYGFDTPMNTDYTLAIIDSYILREYLVEEVKYENDSIKEMRLLLEKDRQKYLSLLSEIRKREERIVVLNRLLEKSNAKYIRIAGLNIEDRTGKNIIVGKASDKSIIGNYKGYVIYKVTSKDGEKTDTGKITFDADGKDIILVKDGKIISSSDNELAKNISLYDKLLLDNDVLKLISEKYKNTSVNYKPDKDHILYIMSLENKIEKLKSQSNVLFTSEATREDVLNLMIKLIEHFTNTSRPNPPSAVFKDDSTMIGTKAYNLGLIGMNSERMYNGSEKISKEELIQIFKNTLKSIKVISGGKVDMEKTFNVTKDDASYFTEDKTITNQSLQKMIYTKTFGNEIEKDMLK